MSNEKPSGDLSGGRVVVPVTPVNVPTRDSGVPLTERGHHIVPMTPLPPAPDRGGDSK